MREVSDEKKAKAGKLLCVDSGAYSDYSVRGFFVVLREFCPHEELEEYLDANPMQRGGYDFEESGFLAVLLSKGLLIEVEFGTLHLTDFSNAEEFLFTPAPSSAQ